MTNVPLRFNRPGIFVPSVTRRALSQGASITRQTLDDFETTNATSTSSFRYDPVGVGMRSTQQLNVDYSTFENHTFFNSAEVKVNAAFENLFNRYPYDGTRREVEAFVDGLTGFDRWVFEQFPKNIGFLYFRGGSFIEVKDHAGIQFPTISRDQTGRSILDPGRSSMTFEMHVHIPAVANDRQVLIQKVSGSSDGFTLALDEDATTASANVIFSFVSASRALTLTGSITKGDHFTHLVTTYDRRAGIDKLFMYADEQLIATSSTSFAMGELDFALAPLFIGSGTTVITGSNSAMFVPTSTFSGALDDLRVFHDIRSLEQQRRYGRRSIFADDTLKLYFKFNEPTGTIGLTSDDQVNRVVLDSSGNSLTSFIDATTFTHELRNTGSLSVPMTDEDPFVNPVLFSTFADVVSLNRTLMTSGSAYDIANPNLITKLIPQHYFLEGQVFEALSNVSGTLADDFGGTGVPGEAIKGQPQLLAALLYLIASELDNMKLFVEQFGNTLFVDYSNYDTTPDQLLSFVSEYMGMPLPGFFNDATRQQFVDADDINLDVGRSVQSLGSVQNELWRRVLSNLNEIIRTKGTSHSIKAFIRSLGIDPDRSFRMREFGGPTNITLSGSREDRSITSTMLRMSGSSVLMSPFLSASVRIEPGYPIPSGDSTTDVLLTSGSWTYEGLYRFPLHQTNVASQSLVRLTTTGSSATSTTPVFNIVALSGTYECSSSLKFTGKPVSGSAGDQFTLAMTGVNVMDGRLWHIAAGRHRNDDELLSENSSPSSSFFLRAATFDGHGPSREYTTASYFLESLDGTHTLDAQQTAQMRIELGATTPETGGYLADALGLTTAFDALVGHIRFWSKGLTPVETREHARNFRSLGAVDPRRNFNFVTDRTGSWQRLRLDASTDQELTSSTSDGGIEIFDFSQDGRHLSGSGFDASSNVIAHEQFTYNIMSPKFDELTTSEKVRVCGLVDPILAERYATNVGYVNNPLEHEMINDDARFTMDYSLADALNEDMINIFATFDALDECLGSSNNVFDDDYPVLADLREIYFTRLTDKVNLKMFFEFFRWFDSSIGMFIEQLIPRKTRFLGINFVVESHMLERSKYVCKFEDVYMGESNRHAAKGTLLMRRFDGVIGRY